MKNSASTLLLLLAVFALSGCYGRGSPKDVVGSAGYALSKNKLKSFRANLTGEALRRYGNQKAMDALRAKLSKKAKIMDVRVLSKWREGVVEKSTYSVTVGVNGRVLLSVDVACDEEIKQVFDPNRNCQTFNGHKNCLGEWVPKIVTDCLITNAR
jgi:hypothetical protein